ncbi:choline ABC transporter ATP-binding protein [Leucothrix pacifica]|uniref:Choline ABC transporter ATP-binding protein n=1 Tax=Leucothrix pacifica TaxID=1247513 RepID=A0A317CEC8_9GAMM|nr:choline ABC transporter ATP-binding protein [Leucothrix pacifica]PWQ96918.1 choline ABC transporter ATP-binding protein [Leucothrix pacifica]
MAAVSFKNVDIIFGESPKKAIEMLDAGATRQEILDTTGNVLGAAGASIDIQEGEICVLMGLSGSGKSTLLRAVNGLNEVTRGEVLVDHNGTQIDVASCDKKTLRDLRTSKVAMVFQQFALLPWRTVRENVGLGLELKGMKRAEREAIVDEKLKLVSLDEWGDKYAHELSGGMQQRVGLARAFATDADILLMDEPFSALDPLIRDKLQDELLDLQRELKKTIIFVSHDLDEAMKIGTHIAIMESGRIVQYGEPEDIVLNPANEYVSEFVAHMNPINVLRAASLMMPLDQMARQGEDYVLDWSGQNCLRINDEGGIASVSIREEEGEMMAYQPEMDLTNFQDKHPNTVLYASPDILMREAINIRYHSGMPVPLVREGRLVGVVGGNEIYHGLLRLQDT